jgi:nicotinate dehydrogenase subunit A
MANREDAVLPMGDQRFDKRGHLALNLGVVSSPSNTGTPRSMLLDVNGCVHTLNIPPETSLLHALRNDLQLNGPKFGCGLGECGACAVLVHGDCVRACVIPVGNINGRPIVTLEGLGTVDRPHPIQQAFITAQAAQCGYCLNGMIMATKALLDRNPRPNDVEIKQALKYHLCRCGTHLEILEAVRLAVESLSGRGP